MELKYVHNQFQLPYTLISTNPHICMDMYVYTCLVTSLMASRSQNRAENTSTNNNYVILLLIIAYNIIAP